MSDDRGAAETEADELLPHLYVAVGSVVVKAAWLEDAMRALHALMIGTAEAWASVGGHGFRQSYDACVALQHKHGSHPDGDRFRAILDHGLTLIHQRNEIVHATWIKLVGVPAPIAFRSARGQVGQAGRHWHLDDVHALARELDEVGAAVQQLSQEIPHPEQSPDN